MTAPERKPSEPPAAEPSIEALASLVAPESTSSPDLLFGAMYWIPEDDTGFTRKGERPYVIVAARVSGQPTVRVCPTTTVDVHERGPRGLIIPAGTLARLPRESVILVDRTFPVHRRLFAYYRFIGMLPQELVDALTAARRALRPMAHRQAGRE